MKIVSAVARLVFSLIAFAVLAAMLLLPKLNDFQRDGIASLPALDQSVSVVRDEKGMAYVRAETLLDAIRAQGYVTAQDRLFQLQLTRIAVSGRLAEFFGESLLDRDKRQRTLGFYRAANKHASLLDDRTRALLQAYADGVNALIQNPNESLPLEMRLIGIPAQEWQIVDSLAILYYMGWQSAADLSSELLTRAIIEKVGLERYREIAPLNINPDDQQEASMLPLAPRRYAQQAYKPDLLNGSQHGPGHTDVAGAATVATGITPTATPTATPTYTTTALQTLQRLDCCGANRLAFGSNNWAVGGSRSATGKPVLANDPHLETSLLPATLYPIGLFTPQVRAVGVNVPGLPGIIFGRNQTVAAGGTNAYADAQDVYIETIDPAQPTHYLEGEQSIPLEIINEEIKVKDKSATSGFRIEQHQIRLTRRGPLISDLEDTATPNGQGKALSVRWAAYESMGPRLGLDYLLRSRSVADVRRSIVDVTAVHLNLVFADTDGHLGWQVTGRIPHRRNNQGGQPVEVVNAKDNWNGWVRYEQMPSRYQQGEGWVGTANHKTDLAGTPFFYSSYFAPDYRYRRMKELFDGDELIQAEQHWLAMRDNLNLLARDVVPAMVDALQAEPDIRELGDVLSAWNYHEEADSAATLIFQEIWRRLVAQTYTDELGQELAGQMTGTSYYWSERMRRMVLDGNSVWFDNSTTPQTETMENVIQAAAREAQQSLADQLGENINQWRWGDLHRIDFVSPLRREGFGKSLLGGGSHAMGGSSHTLYRASFKMEKPGNKVVYSAALRMVVDLADDEKVTAVIPGGVSGRVFTRNFVDQVDEYMSGEKLYWWFDDSAIDRHAQSRLTLLP